MQEGKPIHVVLVPAFNFREAVAQFAADRDYVVCTHVATLGFLLHGGAGLAQVPQYETAAAPPADGRTTVGMFRTEGRERHAVGPHHGSFAAARRRIIWVSIGIAAVAAGMIFGSGRMEEHETKQQES